MKKIAMPWKIMFITRLVTKLLSLTESKLYWYNTQVGYQLPAIIFHVYTYDVFIYDAGFRWEIEYWLLSCPQGKGFAQLWPKQGLKETAV